MMGEPGEHNEETRGSRFMFIIWSLVAGAFFGAALGTMLGALGGAILSVLPGIATGSGVFALWNAIPGAVEGMTGGFVVFTIGFTLLGMSEGLGRPVIHGNTLLLLCGIFGMFAGAGIGLILPPEDQIIIAAYGVSIYGIVNTAIFIGIFGVVGCIIRSGLMDKSPPLHRENIGEGVFLSGVWGAIPGIIIGLGISIALLPSGIDISTAIRITMVCMLLGFVGGTCWGLELISLTLKSGAIWGALTGGIAGAIGNLVLTVGASGFDAILPIITNALTGAIAGACFYTLWGILLGMIISFMRAQEKTHS